MSAGTKNLMANQRQLDMDGCEVGVSRQALEETLSEHTAMVEALHIMLTQHPGPEWAWVRTVLNRADGNPSLLGKK